MVPEATDWINVMNQSLTYGDNKHMHVPHDFRTNDTHGRLT